MFTDGGGGDGVSGSVVVMIFPPMSFKARLVWAVITRWVRPCGEKSMILFWRYRGEYVGLAKLSPSSEALLAPHFQRQSSSYA
jgi:hypothetical protein